MENNKNKLYTQIITGSCLVGIILFTIIAVIINFIK